MTINLPDIYPESDRSLASHCAQEADKLVARPVKTLPRVAVGHPEKCTACRICEITCSLTREHVVNPRKSAIMVSRKGLAGSKPKVCIQCEKAACAEACEQDAIHIDPRSGVWAVDSDKCIGCGSCVDACPISAIYLDADTRVAIKCDLCGGDPQCVRYCMDGVLEFIDSKKLT